MKKFIPYIFITAFIGAFLALSFAGPLSGTVAGPKAAEAGAIEKITYVGKAIWNFTSGTLCGGCAVWGEGLSIASMTFGKIIAWTSDLIFILSSYIFNMSAKLMDYAIDFSILDFKDNINRIGIIDIGYGILLNMANMVFIFILLYISINTILGKSGDVKKLLTNVILVALLINFSLFMTKIIIDAGNIVALGFYRGIKTEVIVDGKDAISQGSISTMIMNGLRLQTILPSKDSEVNKSDEIKGLSNLNIALVNFTGSALLLVAAFVFFATSFLFIIRFIALLLYMLFSPVAFLGLLHESFGEYSKNWWKGLQSQVIFAPVFFFIVYLIGAIVNGGTLWAVVGGGSDTKGIATIYDAAASGFKISFAIIINYAILIALMIAALTTAKKMASEGSHGMVDYADKVRGWMQGAVGGGLGRNIIGRGAYLANETNFMKRLESKSPLWGGFARKSILENIAGSSFGGAKGGYKKALDEKIKQQVARSKNLVYKGKDVDEMSKGIKEEEKQQSSRINKLPGLRAATQDTKREYEMMAGKNDEELKKLKSEIKEIEEGLKNGSYKDKAEEDRQKNRHKEAQEQIKKINLAKEANFKAQEEYEKLDEKIDISKVEIEDKKRALDKLQNKYKSDYIINLPFRSWLMSMEDKKANKKGYFAILDKVLPSYTKAVEEINKGKKTAKELLEEAQKETGEKKEDANEKGKK